MRESNDGAARGRSCMSLSLDLDNQWSYMKTHGDAGWEAFPSYLDAVVERVLPRLERRGLKITFFVVGQDAALAKNHRALRAIADAGHEIGNHSFHHEPWLHEQTREAVFDELARADAAIRDATGRSPRGFRGPGFSLGPDVLGALVERGYLYDCSTFPTFLGPLARLYYFQKSDGLSDEERHKRRNLFGNLSDGLRPIDPYLWDVDGRPLLEIPVTTMPATRAPIHMSYLLYLLAANEGLARLYLHTAIAAFRAGRVEPSFLLHPLDFISGDVVPALQFFPGMNLPTARKLAWFDVVVDALEAHFEMVNVETHASRILARGAGSLRHMRFGARS